MPKPVIMLTEALTMSVSDETVELLLVNLRQQLIDRLMRAGYIIDPATIKAIVRQSTQIGGSTRRAEVWAEYEPHTIEHRAALVEAYDDGRSSGITYRATIKDEHAPTGEDGAPLTGKAWAEYVKALAECPHEPCDPLHEVLWLAWRRGWDEVVQAEVEGRSVREAPYKRIMRP